MIQKILEEAKDMPGQVVNPAAQHLFMVNNEGVKLPEKTAQRFHTITEKLLFI